VHSHLENNLTYFECAKKSTIILTLQYSNASFIAGNTGFSEAKVSMSGGIFSCQRLSSNQGDLSINRRTGRIDQQNSDVGEYIVTYTINHKSVTANIIVLNNN